MEGKGVEAFDQESGGHRIQRIPRNDRHGRIHSSTVTVAVLGGARAMEDDPYSQRSEKDFRIEYYSGSGAGGQHRNKHQNSCRLIHLPTGLVRTAQTRSRVNSLDVAMAAMTAALDAHAAAEASTAENGVRRRMVGSGERSDKRRTYRSQEGLVHDHATGRSADLRAVMGGGLDRLWAACGTAA